MEKVILKGTLVGGYAMQPSSKLGKGILFSRGDGIKFELPSVDPVKLKAGDTVLVPCVLKDIQGNGVIHDRIYTETLGIVNLSITSDDIVEKREDAR